MQVLLNGTDITASVQLASLRILQNAYGRSDSCVFTMRKLTGASFTTPVGSHTLVVTHNTITLFNGTVLSVTMEQVTHNQVDFTVSCKSNEHELDRLLVLERYESTTVGAIITDIMDKYAPDFTYTNVSCTQAVETIAFNRITVSACLDRLARFANYVWYLDYDDDLHFNAKGTDTAPYTITDTSGYYLNESLKIEQDYSQIRNSITIQGGEAEGTSRTELHDTDGTKTTFPLAYKYSSAPTVTVNSVSKTVGVDFLDKASDYDCLWNQKQKYLKFTSAPASGANYLSVTGLPLFPIFIRYNDPSSIGTYGQFEHFLKDPNIKTRKEALVRAQAELSAYSQSVKEGSFDTYTDGFRAGQTVTINSTLLGLNEAYLIQSMTISFETPERPKYGITLATLRTLGIIEVLQRQLFGEEIREDEDELLQAFVVQSDTATATDSITSVDTTSPPYLIGSSVVVGFCTMG